jgi:hypothetical protein
MMIILIILLLHSYLVNGWNSLPPNLLKTPYGYQVLAKNTATVSTIRCDTPWKCKASVALNTINSCTICDYDLGIPASPFYGADKDMEVSPYDQFHLKTFETKEEVDKEGDDESKNEETSNLSVDEANALQKKRKEALQNDPEHNCPPRNEDEFILPCCSPMRDLVTGEFRVTRQPPASQSPIPMFLETTNNLRKQNVGLRSTKMGGGFVGSLLPCCGTGSSCCRWCKDACDELEQINMPRLWWALCNGADREDTEKDNMYRTIDTTMHPFKTSVGGAGAGAGVAAGAASAALGAFRI